MKLRLVALLVAILLPTLAFAQAAKKCEPAKAPAQAAAAKPIMMSAAEMKWGSIPAAAVKGTPAMDFGGTLQFAPVQGDPMKPGAPYTVRLSCTDGAKIPPHWHPMTESVTVIQGTIAIGMGSAWDDAALHDVATGGFAMAPAKMAHYALCKGVTVVQVHGLGPFLINFIPAKPAAPAKKAK